MAILILIKVIIFYVWLKVTTKNTFQIDKYLWGIFSKEDAIAIEYISDIIYSNNLITRMSVIFLGIMQILSIILLSQIRLT